MFLLCELSCNWDMSHLLLGSGCPVTPGPAAAPGPGSGSAADLSPSSDPPSGPGRPGQPAQPPDCHRQLCSTVWSSVHAGRGCKQSSWYGHSAASHAVMYYLQILNRMSLLSISLHCSRYTNKRGTRLRGVAAERRLYAEPQWPKQPACSDGRRGHGDTERGGQEAAQSRLHLPQLQRVWRKVGKLWRKWVVVLLYHH